MPLVLLCFFYDFTTPRIYRWYDFFVCRSVTAKDEEVISVGAIETKKKQFLIPPTEAHSDNN